MAHAAVSCKFSALFWIKFRNVTHVFLSIGVTKESAAYLKMSTLISYQPPALSSQVKSSLYTYYIIPSVEQTTERKT